MGAGAGGIRSHCIHSQEIGRGECGFSSPFLLPSQSKSSVYGMIRTTARVGPPTSINLIYIISDSHAHRNGIHGVYKFYQVDNVSPHMG